MRALRFFFLFFYFSIRDVMGILSIVDFSAPTKESVEYMPKAEVVAGWGSFADCLYAFC